MWKLKEFECKSHNGAMEKHAAQKVSYIFGSYFEIHYD